MPCGVTFQTVALTMSLVKAKHWLWERIVLGCWAGWNYELGDWMRPHTPLWRWPPGLS